jgi:hypothetical protein
MNRVYKHLIRWGDKGIWDDLFLYFSQDADMESILIDGTIVPVQQGYHKGF